MREKGSKKDDQKGELRKERRLVQKGGWRDSGEDERVPERVQAWRKRVSQKRGCSRIKGRRARGDSAGLDPSCGYGGVR